MLVDGYPPQQTGESWDEWARRVGYGIAKTGEAVSHRVEEGIDSVWDRLRRVGYVLAKTGEAASGAVERGIDEAREPFTFPMKVLLLVAVAAVAWPWFQRK